MDSGPTLTGRKYCRPQAAIARSRRRPGLDPEPEIRASAGHAGGTRPREQCEQCALRRPAADEGWLEGGEVSCTLVPAV